MTPKRYLLVSTIGVDAVPRNAPVAVASEHIGMVYRRQNPLADLVIAAADPADRSAFASAAAFERSKYEAYVPVFAERLNLIHGIARTPEFWDRVLGMTLLMQVASCRRVYALCRELDDPAITFRILAESSFVTPADEWAHRRYHQYSDLGDEQLFALLVRSTRGDKGIEEFSSVPSQTGAASSAINDAGAHRLVRRGWRIARRLADDPMWIPREAAIRVLRKMAEPRLLVTQCYWSSRARQTMELRSRGRIVVDDRQISYPRREPDARSDARALLSAPPESGDEFDQFCFRTLRWSAPASWIEDFPARLSATKALLDSRPSVRAVANETVDESTTLLLAEAKDRGVDLYHCEHNYLQHQFVGNMVWFHLRRFDKYLTLGWDSDSEKIVPAASYFDWTEPGRAVRDIPLLFVSSVCMVRPPILSAGYGEAGDNAPGYASMTRRFLSGLSATTLARMYYRDYPAERRAALFLHAVEDTLLEGFRDLIGQVDKTGAESTTSLIARSRLVVVNYLSTAYNQALLAGAPTVVLFNREAYHLTDEHSGFYDELIAAGVFQTDPSAAARFIESIIADPLPWWTSEAVACARAKYLQQNFGEPDSLGRILLDLATPAVG